MILSQERIDSMEWIDSFRLGIITSIFLFYLFIENNA